MEFKKFNLDNSFIFPLLLILFSFLQSCSSSQLGLRLSNNFDYPSDSPSQKEDLNEEKKKEYELEKLVGKKQKQFKKTLSNSNEINQQIKNDLNNKQNIENKPQSAFITPRIKAKIKKFKPQPYRIIIRLSSANPAAPAEAVTKVLREAGIEFEVEKIERFSVYTDSQTLSGKR